MPYPRGAEPYPIRDGIRSPEGPGWIAQVEAFLDSGPYYANAIHPTEGPTRSGPMDDLVVAKQWAERIVNGQPGTGQDGTGGGADAVR